MLSHLQHLAISGSTFALFILFSFSFAFFTAWHGSPTVFDLAAWLSLAQLGAWPVASAEEISSAFSFFPPVRSPPDSTDPMRSL